MPISTTPRSVSDATRFTATTPHASSNAATPPPRFSSPRSGPGAVPPGGSGGRGPGSPFSETPEQKVARLRAAHQRAKAAQVSRFDKFVDAGRRVFDSAHKVTVVGLVGFTVIAGLVTAFTAADMILYNKKRSAEWIEAQKKLEADSLDAARIAYMTGKATDEQISLVEEQLERERESGRTTHFFSQMSVLGTPEAAAAAKAAASAPGSEAVKPQSVTETVSWPSAASAAAKEPSPTSPAAAPTTKGNSLWNWLTSNLKKEEEADGSEIMSAQRRLGWESLSEEDDVSGVRESDIVRAAEEKQAYLRAKARAAFEKEKENQRTGGPLDRVGTANQDKPAAVAVQEETPKKKGWW